MRDRALAMFLRGNQACEVVQHDRSERVDRVLTYGTVKLVLNALVGGP